MKKAIYIVTCVLEALLLIGSYVIDFFTGRKMGMARYVIYKNQGWEEAYPMDSLQKAAMAAVVILALVIILFFIKRRKTLPRVVYAMNLVMLALLVLYLGFTIGNSAETLRSYYFVGVLLAITVLIQEIKTGVAIRVCRYEK